MKISALALFEMFCARGQQGGCLCSHLGEAAIWQQLRSCKPYFSNLHNNEELQYLGLEILEVVEASMVASDII